MPSSSTKKITKYLGFTLIRRFSKRLVLPGFEGVSLYNAAILFFKGLGKGGITRRASAMSFTFFLAVFPSILFFFTLIPYIPIKGFQDTLMNMIQGVLPEDSYRAALSTLEDIIRRQHSGLLSFGFIAALFFAANGIVAIMDAFNESIHVTETRSFLRQWMMALILVMILSVLIITAISITTLGSTLLHYLIREHILSSKYLVILSVTRWIITTALYFFIISFLYYYAPAKHQRYRFISAGSTFATILLILTSLGFNYYIGHFTQYNKLYGSIGALIIILVWIYINAIVLLLGFELDASIKKLSGNK